MKIMKKDIKPNENIILFFALESMRLRMSKNQKHFLELALYDKTGKIKGYLWNDPITTSHNLKEKSYIKVKGTTTLVNDSLIINVEKIRVAKKEEIDIRDFLEAVPGGLTLWKNKLFELVNLIRDTNCRRLIYSFLNDDGFMELFITSPAGISVHHNYIGGLLEHTVNTMSEAALTADNNRGLIDKDLLLTGSFIHDIGKIREIYWEIAKEYTTEGKLLGHIAIGLIMLEEKISLFNGFPEDLSLLLKHMLLSHHGEREHGSPVSPATPEALALHLIENTDAKINHLYCFLNSNNTDKKWTHFDKFLGTEIYQEKFKKSAIKEIEKAVA